MHSRPRGPVSTGRRLVKYESDSDQEDDGPAQVSAEPPALTEAQKELNAKLSQLADLGTGRRHHVTAVDNGRQDKVNLGALLRDRECNQPGTEAADLAAAYRSQLVGWANFGNTTTNDGTYEELPDIARGQSHRQGVAESLLNEGITSLEDTYGGRRRRQGVPPPVMTHGGDAFASVRGGRGAAHVGGRARPGAMSSNPSGRPLDPAIIQGEKDSKYTNGGIQTRARPKAKVRFDSNVVRVTPVAAKGGRVASTARGGSKAAQERPCFPPGLQLADSGTFMAAALACLPRQTKPSVSTKSNPENEDIKKAQLNITQPSVTDTAIPSRSESIATLNGIPIINTDTPQAAVKQISREEFRAPIVSPGCLTDGKPSPDILQSPSVNDREETPPLIGLGIAGFKTEPSVPVPTTIDVEITIMRQFLVDRDIDALIRYLTPLLNISPAAPIHVPNAVQVSHGSSATQGKPPIKPEPVAKNRHDNPFSPREAVAVVDALAQQLPSKPQSKPSSKSVDSIPETRHPKPAYKPAPELVVSSPAKIPQKSQPKPLPAQTLTKSKGLSESKWASSSSFQEPAAKASVLQPKPTNGSLSDSSKNNRSVIIGDIKNVSRLTEEDGQRLKATQAYFPARAKVMTFMQPGDGFKALLNEVEGLKLKPQTQSKSASPVSPEVDDVNAALSTATALSAQFGTYRGKTDGNETDDSEL